MLSDSVQWVEIAVSDTKGDQQFVVSLPEWHKILKACKYYLHLFPLGALI